MLIYEFPQEFLLFTFIPPVSLSRSLSLCVYDLFLTVASLFDRQQQVVYFNFINTHNLYQIDHFIGFE